MVSGVFGRWMVRKSARAHQLLDRRHEVDAELAGAIGAHVRVVGRQLHAERVGPLRDEHAHATEADDAERLVVELDALPPGAVPLRGRARSRSACGHVAGLREQQGDGVLGRRQHVGLRRVHHHDAAPGGRFDVDVVEADAGPADDDELVGRLEDLGGDLGGAADHQRRRAADRVEQLARARARDGRRPRGPAARMASSPLSASCSLTRTRFIGFITDEAIAAASRRRGYSRSGRGPERLRRSAREQLGDALHAVDQRVVGEGEAQARVARARRTPRRARSRPGPPRGSARTARACSWACARRCRDRARPRTRGSSRTRPAARGR